MKLSFTTRVVEGHTVVAVDGEIDVHTAPALREVLAELVRAGNHHLVVDLDRVAFMDSTGLGVLVGALARLRPHEGTLRVVCTHERILQIFRLTGLTKVFPIHDDIDAALAAAADPADSADTASAAVPGRAGGDLGVLQ